MAKKQKNKQLQNTKYFKWGVTAFLVIVASICFVYAVFNIGVLYSGVLKGLKILTPVIDGLIIAYLLNPIMRYIEINLLTKLFIKNNWNITRVTKIWFRVISLILAFVIVGVLVFGFISIIIPQLISSVESIIVHFPTYYDNVLASINRFLESTDLLVENDIIEVFENYSEDINAFLNENVFPNIKNVLLSITGGVISMVGRIFNFIIGIIIAIYLLFSKEKYVGLLKKLIYSLLNKDKANQVLVDMRYVDKTFGGFIVGKIIDSIIIGFICFFCLSLLKTPYAMLVSVIVGITNIIPFFGPYLGAIPSTLLILLVNPRQALIFVIFIIILQQVDGNIIGPAILGNSLGLSSFWIIVAITVFGGLFGVFGMIVGAPVFACAYTFIKRRVNRRLLDKNLPISTYAYAETEYITQDNKIVTLDAINYKRTKKGNEEKWYIRFAKWCEKTYQLIAEKVISLYNKLFGDKNDQNS